MTASLTASTASSARGPPAPRRRRAPPPTAGPIGAPARRPRTGAPQQGPRRAASTAGPARRRGSGRWHFGAARVQVPVGGVHPVEGLGRQRGHVVGAQQAEVRRVGEGPFEQRFVQCALRLLGEGALGPDRLADPADRTTSAAGPFEELRPGRDEAGRVAADLVHREQLDLLAVVRGSAPRSRSRRTAGIATNTGSSASTASLTKGTRPSRYSSSPS